MNEIRLNHMEVWEDDNNAKGYCVVCAEVSDTLIGTKFTYIGKNKGRSFYLYMCNQCYHSKIKGLPMTSLNTFIPLLRIREGREVVYISKVGDHINYSIGYK